MTARGWPHAELETMVELWNAGTLSLVEIAVKMGKTKAMINGMAHRMPNRCPPKRTPVNKGKEPAPLAVSLKSRWPLPAGHPITWGAISALPWPADLGFMTASRVTERTGP